MSATITSAEITFDTTGDDKDWNTKPAADINLDERAIAILDCCSSDRKADNWTGGPVTKPLIIRENALKSDLLARGTCSLGGQAVGDDDWQFNASLAIHYSDGTSSYFSGVGWNNLEVHSQGGKYHNATPTPIKL